MAKRDYIQHRKQRLIAQGFLPFEAEYYARFPLNQPGMRKIIRSRIKQVKQAREAGIASPVIPSYIQDSYKAKGYVDAKGKLDAEVYNSNLFDELEKPAKKRKQLFIIPSRYTVYRRLVQARFAVQDAGNLADSIPPEVLPERMKMYKALRKAHYSPYEAIYIVTAQTPEDKHGKSRLQKLDLTQDVWQTAMKERDTWFKKTVKAFIDKGMPRDKAAIAAINEVDRWYRKDKQRTPFDEVEDISPSGPSKPTVDFKDALENRKKKQRGEKMPWRTRG